MARARYRRRNLAARAQARATALARRPAGSAPERHSQAAAAAEADEALAVLPINRQVFTRVLVLTGNARRAVREAGYGCKSPKVETAMAREILASPSVQRALEALRWLRGLDAGALDEFLAVPLSGCSAPPRSSHTLKL
jgi:hypothetical protein